MGYSSLLSTIFIFLSILVEGQVFVWHNPNLSKDSTAKDSILSAKVGKEIFLRDTLGLLSSPLHSVTKIHTVPHKSQKILETLNTQGAIIRGITFGNAQGTSAQSSMDLQISGKITPDISLLASISDHNLPIQADGYTQTLDEFDKIYLQLNIKNKTLIRAGHLDLNDDTTFFGKYQRRSLGLELRTQWGKEQNTHIQLSAGIARSEFHRMRFQGIEGNLGPYRLLGKNGEPFITIISGSEQVFIDGILMKRGENLDYTINYNTGEINFTSFRPIYKQNFITISYNYTNRNYTRFLTTGAIAHQREKLKLGINWFLEQDNKNAPIAIDLSSEDQKILANAGNNTSLMLAPSGIPASYDVNKILYRKNTSQGTEYYEFSTNENETLYQVSFSHMGTGKGDYKIQQSTNNGRVFLYVGPGKGDYSALRKLPAPVKSQVLSTHAEYTLEDGKIATDFSISIHDTNLFSAKDNHLNTGYATRIFAKKTFRKKHWQGTPTLEFQHMNAQFHILDRINNVEFAREFNLAQEFNQKTQNRLIFSFLNTWDNGSKLDYQLNYLTEKNSYKGFKNTLDFQWQSGAWHTSGKGSWLRTQSQVQDSKFFTANIEAQHRQLKGNWSIGASMEHNVKTLPQLNIMEQSSFAWREISLKKNIERDKKTLFSSQIYFRQNDSVRLGKLSQVNHILGVISENHWIDNQYTQLKTSAHYRNIHYKEKNTQNFLVGNILYHQQLLHNGLRLQAFYELGNGQEAQRDFQYLKVTDGQGIYKWTDYNTDGIQQIDEFEVAEYTDLAQYIRVYTNTIKYLPSNKNKLQLALYITPAIIFHSENSFFKRWNFNLSLNTENAYIKGSKTVTWNPFEKNKTHILKNQQLLAAAQFLPNTLSGWNGVYRFIHHHNLFNANFSQEEKQQRTHFLNIGYKFTQNFRIDWENQYQYLQNHSELFKTRDYSLYDLHTRPKIIYKIEHNLQAEASSALIRKKRINGIERLKSTEITGSLQWDYAKTTLRGSFSFIHNQFTGNSFSIVGNQMLSGLKTGKNQIWNLILQQDINSFLKLNLNYEGRNSGERTIHTGSVQIKAGF